MSLPVWTIPVGTALIDAGVDALRKKYSDETALARDLAGIILAIVPREQLIAFLSEEGIERAELVADIAEQAKFGARK